MGIRFAYFLAVLGLVLCECNCSRNFNFQRTSGLGCDDIKKFVDGHNMRRLQLARGEVDGQPPASQMNKIIWDDELAAKAAKLVAGHKYRHNPDRTIPSNRFTVGENIFMHSTTSNTYDFDPEIVMANWFDEYKRYKFRPLRNSDFYPGVPAIGHYTQMAWSDTTYIGCAVSKYRDGKWHNTFVACNYGPTGNVVGQTPYIEGRPSGDLTCGTSSCRRMYGSC